VGESSARITAADFLTPPELAPWKLAANGAGRIGGVRLTLTPGAGGTRLGDCYQQVPLRVLPPFRCGQDRPTLLYLLNPTAGLMDGDAQLVQVSTAAKTQALVVGQSATRIHPAIHGFCTQRWAVRVEPGAILVILPGAAIPFAGCRYYQHVDIDLAAGAGLVWGDIWLAGRYARGGASEQFQFGILVQQLTVRRQGRLVFRDRFCWRGSWDRAAAAWHFGGDVAYGSLFITGSLPEAVLDSPASLTHVALPTASGDSCLRCHGPAEAVTAWVVQTALRTAANLAEGEKAAPWLRPWLDLGPNHWFSPSLAPP
jgi:urease accessory protein